MKDLKSVPLGVYIAVIFLVLFYVMIGIAFPMLTFVLTTTTTIGTVLSFMRISHYLRNGN